MKTFLWLTGWATGLLILVLLITALAVNQSRRQLEAYRAALEKRGESFDIVVLAPRPPVNKQDNGALSFLSAAEKLNNLVNSKNLNPIQTPPESSPGHQKVHHRQTHALLSQAAVPWDQIIQNAQVLEPVLGEIRRAASQPHFEVTPDYSLGFFMPLPGVSAAMTANHYLNQQGILSLRENNVSEAVENVVAILRLARMTENQPVLICGLCAAVLTTTAQSLTWEILQSQVATDPDLARLQGEWAQVSPLRLYKETLRLERALALPQFDSPTFLSSSTSSGTIPGTSWWPVSLDKALDMGRAGIWSTFYRYADARQFMENYQTLIDGSPTLSAQGPWRNTLRQAEGLQAQFSEGGIKHRLGNMVISILETTLRRLISIQALAHMTQTAIALRRYQLSRGQYPESLADLVPAWLPAVPFDPFDARPLRYRRLANEEYLLYSLGPNGIDENGDATKAGGSRRKGFLDGNDLVWPRVAPTP